MGLIPAKCFKCGADLIVDESEESGLCPRCGCAFLTEEVLKFKDDAEFADGVGLYRLQAETEDPLVAKETLRRLLGRFPDRGLLYLFRAENILNLHDSVKFPNSVLSEETIGDVQRNMRRAEELMSPEERACRADEFKELEMRIAGIRAGFSARKKRSRLNGMIWTFVVLGILAVIGTLAYLFLTGKF